MEKNNLNLPKRLLTLNSSMKKIILLVTVVLVLILVNIFVVLYGKTKNGGSDKTDLITDSQITDNNSNTKDLAQSESDATKVLLAFLGSLRKNDVNNTMSYLSVNAQLPMFKQMINDGIRYGEDFTFNILNVKYSAMENYAYIATEISKESLKEYYKFTLVKEGGVWKVILVERI